jgi:hypothetical protein
MKRFEAVRQILQEAVLGKNIGVHGNFWNNRTLPDFINKPVRGKIPIVPGDPDNSNLVKALEGRPPFDGSELDRMPIQDERGFRIVPPERIAIIRQWITDGCPDDDLAGSIPPLPPVGANALNLNRSSGAGVALQAVNHIDFWLALDEWSLEPNSAALAAVEAYQPITPLYRNFLKNPAGENAWRQAVAAQSNGIKLLSNGQLRLVRQFYGDPINIELLCDSFELFGRDELPQDPRHGDDPHHTMDGRRQWVVWASFVDAATQLNAEAATWLQVSRAILVGLLNDGLFRPNRFTVTGFTQDDAGKATIHQLGTGLSDADVPQELLARIRESGLLG